MNNSKDFKILFSLKLAGIFTTLFLTASLLSLPARADCTNPASIQGVMMYNADFNVMQFCDGTDWIYMGAINPSAGSGDCTDPDGAEGEMVYNVDYKTMQFCNGENWIAMSCNTPSSYGCTPPSGCGNIGDLCADGSLFAGFMLNGSSCRAIFVTADNQSTSITWSTESVDTGADSFVNGQANQTDIVANHPPLSNYPAFELCENLTDHSQTDWYFPARNELQLLWENRTAIDANATGAFTTGNYWSSSERLGGSSWYEQFSDSFQLTTSKGSSADVRCVRSEDATPPWGCTDDSLMQCMLEPTRSNDDPEFTAANIADGVNILGVTGILAGGGCNIFTNFDFTDVFAPPSTLTESGIIQIDTDACAAAVSVSGEGSPQFRTCTNGSSDANCDSTIVQDWIASGTLNDNEYLQLRLTSSPTDMVTRSATVTVSSVANQWDVTTGDPCDGSPAIGTLCDDGSIYAGDHPTLSVPIYVTDDDQSAASLWKTSTGTDDIAADSDSDGQSNQSQVVPPADGTFPAFDDCYTLNQHSQTDWYLPAKDELNLLRTNKAAINANALEILTGNYWSSTEVSNNSAWFDNVDGGGTNTNKNSNFKTRCVRRD